VPGALSRAGPALNRASICGAGVPGDAGRDGKRRRSPRLIERMRSMTRRHRVPPHRPTRIGDYRDQHFGIVPTRGGDGGKPPDRRPKVCHFVGRGGPLIANRFLRIFCGLAAGQA